MADRRSVPAGDEITEDVHHGGDDEVARGAEWSGGW